MHVLLYIGMGSVEIPRHGRKNLVPGSVAFGAICRIISIRDTSLQCPSVSAISVVAFVFVDHIKKGAEAPSPLWQD